MEQTQESARALEAELAAGSEALACQEGLIRAAEANLDSLERHLAGADGNVAECLAALRGELGQLRRQCVEAWVALLERIRAVATVLGEQMDGVLTLATLGELSASVAHEIRNPLCGMLLSVEVLQTKIDPGDSRAVLLDNLHREAEKMEKVVNNLLHFARQYRPRPVRCRLQDVIQRGLDSIKRHLQKGEIQVSVECADADVVADVDPDMVHQVLRNILLNAVDASPKGGALEVKLSGSATGDEASVTITDHGEGIEPEHLERIFDPFFTSKHNGVGLGLSVSRKIIDAHNGRIEVQSRPGLGATFRLVFPGKDMALPAQEDVCR